eukprot:TRINITY_DN6060_c0_g1_i5.p1 TRINITY_DN6060_c0_g1~~TRINITY_DN6060_c0_g1_i5.p1  ORF type:complete len:118 (+),score=11.75 TRINITY_DN6060_c0_g1_i5:249-602(+)
MKADPIVFKRMLDSNLNQILIGISHQIKVSDKNRRYCYEISLSSHKNAKTLVVLDKNGITKQKFSRIREVKGESSYRSLLKSPSRIPLTIIATSTIFQEATTKSSSISHSDTNHSLL